MYINDEDAEVIDLWYRTKSIEQTARAMGVHPRLAHHRVTGAFARVQRQFEEREQMTMKRKTILRKIEQTKARNGGKINNRFFRLLAGQAWR